MFLCKFQLSVCLVSFQLLLDASYIFVSQCQVSHSESFDYIEMVPKQYKRYFMVILKYGCEYNFQTCMISRKLTQMSSW